MSPQPCVWVVGPPEHWVSELLLRTELDIRCASVWADLDDAGRRPDALIVTAAMQCAPGFGTIVSRFARLPLILIDEDEEAFTIDAADRSLVVDSARVDVMLEFLADQLSSSFDPIPTQRRQVPALIRADDVSFVGRTVRFSERGLVLTVPGLRLGLDEVEIALFTSGPCVRFDARVERHLRADGETHLGLAWRNLDEDGVRRVLRVLAQSDDGGSTVVLPSPDGDSEDLPDWVERALSGLAYTTDWSHRVLQGRIETAIQLSSPVAPEDLLRPTRDL